jgi:hypothetical protein
MAARESYGARDNANTRRALWPAVYPALLLMSAVGLALLNGCLTIESPPEGLADPATTEIARLVGMAPGEMDNQIRAVLRHEGYVVSNGAEIYSMRAVKFNDALRPRTRDYVVTKLSRDVDHPEIVVVAFGCRHQEFLIADQTGYQTVPLGPLEETQIFGTLKDGISQLH